MPQKYTSSDQVKFLGEWFDTWSDYQKDDFLPILRNAVLSDNHVNGISNDMSEIKLTGRRPSLFDCQVYFLYLIYLMFLISYVVAGQTF